MSNGEIQKDPSPNNVDEFLLKLLFPNGIGSVAWIQRKETAVWSAVALYLAGLLYLLNFITTKERIIVIDKMSDVMFFLMVEYIIVVMLALFLMVLFLIIWAFIHSQFSVIYNTNAEAYVYYKRISESLRNKAGFSGVTEFIIRNPKGLGIIDPITIRQNELQRFPDDGLRIIKLLWLFWKCIFNLSWKWVDKNGKPQLLSPINKQEAAIYSLMIVVNLVVYVLCSLSILLYSCVLSHNLGNFLR